VIAERLTAQLLAGPPAADPVAVCERLLAVQGQDLRGARLAVRSRTTGLSVADVDAALADRSLLIAWVNRGTLHLIRSEDYAWLHALTTPQLAKGIERRLREERVSEAAAERGVKAIVAALDDGPKTRDQLREAVTAAGVAPDGQGLIQLMALASLRGLTVRGPMAGKQQAHVLVRDWLGEQPAVDRERALAELARRYLAGHGPAGDSDLARWAGLPLRDARAGLAAIAGELEQRDDGLVDLAKRPPAAELPPPRLLGPFDPLLLGWASREPILGDNTSVVTINGIFKAIALVEGRGVATWTMPKGKVELAPFGRLSKATRAALDVDAADVERFLKQ
jgi:uncharacterized protein YcaQ